MQYFFLLDAHRFQTALIPALAESWRANSFAPARGFCQELESIARGFVRHDSDGAIEPVVVGVGAGKVRFSRDLWRLLAAELLLFAAAEMPEIETPVECLALLLKQQLSADRNDFSPLQKATFGSRDLLFGSVCYRPDCAGWNDWTDVADLAAWLAQIRPETWSVADLPGDDAQDDLEFAREWFPGLVEMYHRAVEQHLVIVCETL